MEPCDIKDFILGLRDKGMAGLNVTIPYISDVMSYLASISPEAKKIGAVNTIFPTERGLMGYNTDYFGVKSMLGMAGILVKGKKVMVLGTGGSARTVVTFLKDEGASNVALVSRNKDSARKKFSGVDVLNYTDITSHNTYDVLINTTPVGMYPNTDESPLSKELTQCFPHVADLIYNPAETLLLRYAKECGANYVNGLYMLVAQAVKAQEIWNNISISDDIIDKIYQDTEV
jgi:shikimate dehydrogenase